MPICPARHHLRSQVVGDLTEISLAKASLQGFAFCATYLLVGIMEDARRGPLATNHVPLMLMTGLALILGTLALADAWTWAGRSEPAYRLTRRAFGNAVGFLLPALIAAHALYFHWIGPVESAFYHSMFHLGETIIHSRL